MALFENFPYTNLHELNLDWIIETLKKCYSPDNPPESMVISVNGASGVVTLYPEAIIRFPDVPETQWNMWRNTDGTSTGIQFEKDQPMKHIQGNQRFVIYDSNNPPPYPVVSVNGQTGEIELYTTAYVEFPNVSSDNWGVQRKLNTGTEEETTVGIMLDDTGKLQVTKDETGIEVFTEDNPPPYPVRSVNGQTGDVTINPVVSSVDGMTGAVQTWGYKNTSKIDIPIPALGDDWSIGRVIDQGGNLSIKLMYDDNTQTCSAYMVYDDGENAPVTIKLLTLSDIPSSSGVVSINSQTGVVTLYANGITMSANDPTSIETAINTLKTACNERVEELTLICNGDTHPDIYTNQLIYIRNHATLAEGFYRVMPGGLTQNSPFVENTNVIKINNNMINNIIVVDRLYVTLDANGVGTIGWPYNNGHPGGLMLGAYPTTWNPTTTTFTNSGFAEIKCPSLAGQTALFNCVWIQPMWNPVPPAPTP